MVLYPLVSSLAIYYSYLPTSIMPVITRSQSKMKTSSILERSMFQTSLTGFYAELSDTTTIYLLLIYLILQMNYNLLLLLPVNLTSFKFHQW